MAGLMKPILSNPTTQPQPPSSPTAETPEIDSKPSESVTTESKTPEEEESSQPPAKKQKKKCGVCKKKLGLTGKSNLGPPIEISKYTENWRFVKSRFDLTIYSPGDGFHQFEMKRSRRYSLETTTVHRSSGIYYVIELAN